MAAMGCPHGVFLQIDARWMLDECLMSLGRRQAGSQPNLKLVGITRFLLQACSWVKLGLSTVKHRTVPLTPGL